MSSPFCDCGDRLNIAMIYNTCPSKPMCVPPNSKPTVDMFDSKNFTLQGTGILRIVWVLKASWDSLKA